MIYNCENSIFAISKWESRDQVHGYLLEWTCIRRDCNAIEGGFLLMSNDFVLLASGTSFNIIGDPVIHPGPLVDFFGFSNGFISAQVSRCHMIMSVGHNRMKEFVSWLVNNYSATNM